MIQDELAEHELHCAAHEQAAHELDGQRQQFGEDLASHQEAHDGADWRLLPRWCATYYPVTIESLFTHYPLTTHYSLLTTHYSGPAATRHKHATRRTL